MHRQQLDTMNLPDSIFQSSNTGNKLHTTLLQTVHFMPVKLKGNHGHVEHQAINILNSRLSNFALATIHSQWAQPNTHRTTSTNEFNLIQERSSMEES